MSSLFSKTQPVTQTSNSTTTPSVAPWVSAGQTNALSTAEGIPAYTPYSGPTVAPLTPAQLTAIQTAINGNGAYSGAINGGINAATGVAGMAAPTITGTNVSSLTGQLMNPFTSQLITSADQPIEQQIATQNQNNDEGAAGIGAFGGNRAAVGDALNNYYGGLELGNTNANIENNAFNTASNNATGIATTNANNNINTGYLNLGGANALNNLGIGGTNINANNINELLAAGGVQQNTGTQADQTALQQYEDVYNSLFSRLGGINQTLGTITPSNTSTTSNGTSTQQIYSSPLTSLLGLGLGIGSLGTGAGATLGGSFLSGLGGDLNFLSPWGGLGFGG